MSFLIGTLEYLCPISGRSFITSNLRVHDWLPLKALLTAPFGVRLLVPGVEFFIKGYFASASFSYRDEGVRVDCVSCV